MQRSVTRDSLLWLAVLFAGIIAVVLPRTVSSTLTRTQESRPAAVAVRQITLATKDLVYDPLTQRIYASVPSSAGAIGNSITQIDPVPGTIGASVSIGSEPGKLAISDNSQYIYVALDGAAAVRRFDLTTQTAGLQFLLGSGISGVYSAEDISVMPGQADSVAISRQDPNSNHGGVAIYDNGVARSNTTPPPTGSNVIEFSSNASTLYGYNNESSEFGLRKMAVDSFGVTVVSTTRNLISNFGTNIVQHNGLLYSTRGQVVDPETLTRVGTFPLTDFPSFVLPDSSANRVYFLSGFFSSTVTLRAFDLTTFVQVGSLSINGISGNPSSLIKWGADGLAFRTSGNQVFLVSISEIVPFPATPIPSPTQEATGITSLSLVANDLVFDPNSQKVYASLPSGAGTFGNSIAAIAPATGVMETPIFIGSEPHRLAISDNGQYVYAGLDGSATVRRFDTLTQTAGLQFDLGNDSLSGPMSVDDIAVMPGSPTSIAVSEQCADFSPRHQGVAIFDDAVMRPVKTPTHTGPNVIEFSTTSATLYGYNNETTAYGLYKMAVDGSGVSVVSTAQSVITGFGRDIRYDNGLLYTTAGRAVDPETATLVGSFSGASGPVVPDSAAGRVYYVTGSTLRAYDTSTFRLTGTLAIPNLTGTPASLIRWGANGLAFRTDTKVYFISISAIVPTPATPVPTPIQVAPNVIRLPLATNDLVYDANTQRVYASVPGAGGSFGNSVVPINPLNGTMGTPVFVGSEPTKLALSSNNQLLYLGLDGSGKVRAFDLASQTPGLQFPLGRSPSTGTYFVDDITTMPGNQNVIAVSRRNIGITPRHEGVAIYDNGLMRPVVTSFTQLNEAIDFSSVPTRIYGYDNESSGAGFQKLTVDANGVTILSSTPNIIGGKVDIKFDNGRVYSSGTGVANAEAATLAGMFSPPPNSSDPSAFVPASSINRIFFVTDTGAATALKAYDTNTFAPVGTYNVPGVTGTAASLVRFGTNGFAFRTSDNQVFFVRTPFIPINLVVNDSSDAADNNVGDTVCDTNVAPGDQCTLRAAIQETNADAATQNSILFDPSLNGSTIALATALPDIGSNVNITGPDATLLTIQRSNAGGTPEFRVFTINSGKIVTIAGLTISNGKVTGTSGGGISNSGVLTLNNAFVSRNSAGSGGTGGGIQNLGTLNVNYSLISNNVGGGVASNLFGGNTTATINNSVIRGNTVNGGVYNNGLNAIATMAINTSIISGNSANSSGGGIFNGAGSFTSVGKLTLTNCTISGNSAGAGGGGLYTAAVFGNASTDVTINNSTISGNSDSSASGGGGIYHISNGTGSIATLTINNGTIVGNNANAGSGGGIRTEVLNSVTNLNLRNTMVAGNLRSSGTISSDISGSVNSGSSFNLIGDGTDMSGITNGSNGNQVGTSLSPINPKIGPLASNGGLTETHALLPGSPALDGATDVALTTLNGAIDNLQTVVNVTDARGIPANAVFTILINSEQIIVVGKSANALTVARGANGTTAVSHSNSENVFPALDQRGANFLRKRDSADADTNPVVDIGAFEAQASVEDISDKSTAEDIPLSFSFNVGDAAAITSVTASSSNPTLVPNSPANINLTGSGSTRTLNITPATNQFGTSTITVTVNTVTESMSDTFVLTVAAVADTPSVTNATTSEDIQTSGGLVVSRNAADGAEVTHFKLTGITNGTLFKNNGFTQINNGDFILVSEGNAGLRFTPAANLFGTGSFTVQASTSNSDAGLGGGTATATITVSAVADPPTVTNSTTSINRQTTSGLVITTNGADGAEVTHFKIGSIQNGTLFKNDGTTQILNNTFITVGEGNAGLKFTPGTNLFSPTTTFSFEVRGATSAGGAGLGSAAIASITVNCGGASSTVTNTNDSGTGSLRDAILKACPGNTITFNIPTSDPGFSGGIYTITLTSGELTIDRNLTITGLGANVLTVKRSTAGGTANFRIFTVNSGVTVDISGLTITNGRTADGANNGSSGDYGGGIRNSGTLTLTNCTISSNRTGGGGSSSNFGGEGGVGGGIYNEVGATMTVTNCIVSSNQTGDGGSGTNSDGGFGGNGGGIYNAGALTMSNSTVSGNRTGNADNGGGNGGNGGSGGGVLNFGTATLTNNTISDNQTGNGGSGSNFGGRGGSGGGVANGDTLTLIGNTISTNQTGNGGNGTSSFSTGGSGGFGGGITNGGTLSLTNSTIDSNQVGGAGSGTFGGFGGSGGGIHNGRILILTNSTITSNQSGSGGSGTNNGSHGGLGGGIYNEFVLAVTNATVSGNHTGIGGGAAGGGSGGGIYNCCGPTNNIKNTIVANNTLANGGLGTDLYGTFNSQDYNLIKDPTGATINGTTAHNITGQDPRLGPLANNGGLTQTEALLAGSPALDAADDCVTQTAHCGDPNIPQLTTDQRGAGFARIVDGPDADTTDTVDIGAFEAQVSVADTADQSINEDSALVLFFHVGGAANITGVTATSSNTALVPNDPGNIEVSGSGSTLRLVVTPAANTFGSSTITVTVNGSNSQTMTDTFLLTVNSVNDAPSFMKGLDQTLNENDGAQTVNNWASNTSAGPANESGQTVNFVVVSNSNASLFAVAPVVSPTGTLTYTPATGVSGTALITIALMDNGGTANGGLDTSASQSFNINVREGGTLQFSSATFAVAEDGVNAVISVTRTGGSGGEARVNYATSNGTATAGQDYTAVAGTLTFPDGITSQSFNLAITNDLLHEPDETINLTLTSPAGSGSLGAPANAVLTINDNDPQGGTIAFASPSFTVTEIAGSILISVERRGDTTQAVTVDYATADVTADGRKDYTPTRGTLHFDAGIPARAFPVLVNIDAFAEGSELVELTLSNPTGGAVLGVPATATLQIDNTPWSSPPANSIDDAQSFVRQHYHDFLNRDAANDPDGLAFWTNQITECQQPGATCDAALRRINVSAAFFLSIEFQETGYLVYRVYKAGYGNIVGTPVPVRFSEFLPDTQQIGKDVVVGQTGWEQRLENNKVAFALDFATRSRFTTAYPTMMTPPQFVDALFTNAGVTPSPTDRDATINEFGGAGNTVDVAARGRALRRVAENSILRQQETNNAFVLMQYFGYLRRNPNDAPEQNLNFDGYNFWLGKLNQFNGNFVNAEMVKAFIISGEYRQRFGP